MNTVELIKVLQNKINGSVDSQEVIYLSKAIELLNIGVVKTVNTFSDLSGSQTQEIYFVEDEKSLYYFGGGRWFLLFDTISLELYAWGRNLYGRLGDGTTTDRSSPVSVVGGFTDWISTSAGYSHSLGIRANGSLWAWGHNYQGRLGNGRGGLSYGSTYETSPVSVIGGFSDWVQVSAGYNHTLALRANGSIWSWGGNYIGQLGNGNSGFDISASYSYGKSSPVSVVGGFTDWILVSAGSNFSHSLGVRANGSLWAWGSNTLGQLGDDTITDRSSPVSVVGGFTDWISASAGGGHILGVRANGTLWAWGRNSNGRLGDNTATNRSSPVSVVGGFTDWISASAGNLHSLGVRANGSLWAWGNNGQGRLGDNTITDRSSPVSVVGGFTDWISASAGGLHSLGVRANGSLWAWGFNSFGTLGDNTVTSRSSPVSVVGGFTDWIQASAVGTASLGIKNNE
jgi:alpha-tubulin suppressor-like RCC1 family protein